MLPTSRSKATVLAVEDDAVTRELLAHLLQSSGYDVIAVPTGECALLVLCQLAVEIDWLVSKASLPGLVCGSILADEYHEHHPSRPVLLVSSRNRFEAPSSATTIVISQGTPMRVLEVLQALKNPESARGLQFPEVKAA